MFPSLAILENTYSITLLFLLHGVFWRLQVNCHIYSRHLLILKIYRHIYEWNGDISSHSAR